MKLMNFALLFALGCIAHADDVLPFDDRTLFVKNQNLTDGFEFRVEKPEVDGRYHFVLRIPEGKEALVWNPPGFRPSGDALTPYLFGEVVFAKVSERRFCAIVSGGDSWWWIRWDLDLNRRLPLIEFFGARTSMGIRLLDGNSVRVFGKMRDYFTLTADAEGNVHREGRPWLEGPYHVYGDNWETIHGGPAFGNIISRYDSAKGWPYDDGKAKPTLRKNPVETGPAKQAQPPKRGEMPLDPGRKTESTLATPVGRASGASSGLGGWAVWAGIATVLAAFAGLVLFRAKGRRDE